MKRYAYCPSLFLCLAAVSMVAAIGLAHPGAVLGIDFSKSTGDERFDDGQGHIVPYRLFPPSGYQEPGAKYPLVLYLQGAGGRGTDNKSHIDCTSMDRLLSATQGDLGAQYKAFFLAPQIPETAQWVDRSWASGSYTDAQEPAESAWMKDAMTILDTVVKTYPVDTRRIYITGISMGGCGTWDAIRRYPNRFAAATPLSGAGNRDQGTLLKHVPIWAYHGALDTVIPVSATDQMSEAIKGAGGSMEYTRAADIAHAGWEMMFDRTSKNSRGKDLYEWMFSQALSVPSHPR
jgi:predicted peptidase